MHNVLVAICPMQPIQPPYPKSYDANAKCDYHGEAIGNSMKNCRPLIFKVQSMIEAG